MDQQISWTSINWQQVEALELTRAASGSKLPSLFERAWVMVMPSPIPCFNCKGFEKSLSSFKKTLKAMESNTCEYQLQAKYNGIRGISNATITNAQAKKLIKEHPKGEALFAKLPEKKKKAEEAAE